MQQSQRGFGGIEIVIGLCVLALISLIVASVWNMNSRSQSRVEGNPQQQVDNQPTANTPNTDDSTENVGTPQTAESNQPTTSNTQPQSPNLPAEDSNANIVSTTVTYRIGTDGTAQLAPVRTRIDNHQLVNLTIDLQCLSSCQFKLVSDTHPVASDIYDRSQKITYRLDRPGEHLFYNQYTPNIKFGIAFGQ